MKNIILLTALLLSGCYGTELVIPNDGHLNEIESGVAWITDVNSNTFKVFLSAPGIENGVILYINKEDALYVTSGQYIEVLNPVFWNSFEIVNGKVYNLELLTEN